MFDSLLKGHSNLIFAQKITILNSHLNNAQIWFLTMLIKIMPKTKSLISYIPLKF